MTSTKDELHKQAVAMSCICDERMASNPIAWYELHKAGITRGVMQRLVDDGTWLGSPPVFEKAPDIDSPIWAYMVEQDQSKQPTKQGPICE